MTLPGDLVRAEALLRERDDGGAEEEILLIECFVDPRAVDACSSELEGRDARVDEIDRDLPSATVIRAYATRAALRGLGARLHALGRRGRDLHHPPLAPRAAGGDAGRSRALIPCTNAIASGTASTRTGWSKGGRSSSAACASTTTAARSDTATATC